MTASPFLVTREVMVPTVVVLEAEENSLERRQWTFSRKEKGKNKKECGGYQCRELKHKQLGWQYRHLQPAVPLAGKLLSAEPLAPRIAPQSHGLRGRVLIFLRRGSEW